MTVGERIKQLRTAKGLTLEEVGNFVGVGKSTVRKWETGDIANMRRDKISRLALILGVSPSFLIGDADESTPALPDELSEAKRELIEIIKQMPDERVKAVLAILKG